MANQGLIEQLPLHKGYGGGRMTDTSKVVLAQEANGPFVPVY